MQDILEFVLSVLTDAFSEVLFKAFFFALPALTWAAGAYCLLCPFAHGAAAGLAAVAACLCGGLLTYLWSQDAKWARNTLLAGVAFSIAVVTIYLTHAPRA